MSTPDLIRILIVDDHPSVREGLSEMLAAQADMTVVGAARDGEEAVRAFDVLRPDITIIDLRLPKLDGLEAIRQMRLKTPEGRFVVMTSFDGDQGLAQARLAGASAYIFKEMFGEELLDVIRAVHSAPAQPNQS